MFQSTPPARGATVNGDGYGYETEAFQSTPPRGGRPHTRHPLPGGRFVSIHAPARGATGRVDQVRHGSGVSIHAPARGATQTVTNGRTYTEFQSTPPRGGRRVIVGVLSEDMFVSIHAPARGATKMQSNKKYFSVVSIHAPARGATRHRCGTAVRLVVVSIHAPARGATDTLNSRIIVTRRGV